MAFNPKAYSTLQYEVPAIADSATTLPPGTALKITRLPISPPTKLEDNWYNVAAAGVGEEVHAVVSAKNVTLIITDKLDGRVAMLNAGLIPVLLGADLKKGDHLKPSAGGKWVKGMTGDEVFAELIEDGAKDGLAWAKPDVEKL